jgi:isopenicillin-N epimerase
VHSVLTTLSQFEITLPQVGVPKELWCLDPSITFLNHGSFGACPRPVLRKQAELREELEREPVSFMKRGFQERVDQARNVLATFLGAEADGLAFVPNATTGANTVLRSLVFASGDEVLVTNHGYNAVNNAVAFACDRARAQVRRVQVPFPIASAEAVTEAILEAVTPKTRLVVVDHITSPTALTLPVETLVARLANAGVDVLVDGAHAPAMLDLNLRALGAAYYVGNAHKWLCAPKGAAFLYVREDRRERIHPLSISHGATAPLGTRSRFQLEMDWTGTHDPTAYLSIPEAIECLGSILPGGWPELRRTVRERTLEARRIVADAIGMALPCPDDMVGFMSTLILPPPEPALTGAAFATYLERQHTMLFEDHRIEVPIFPFPTSPGGHLRLSCHVYNDLDEYRRLADVLRAGL